MSGARLDLKIGFACNNHCRFCVQGDKRSRVAPPSTDTLLRELEQGRDAADGVVFTGGEPTLRPELPALVRRARELGYATIQIQSNGRMFASRVYCERLLDAGATEFSPALHAPTPALHDHLTRADGSFRQTLRGIRTLKQLGAFVLTNSVVVRPNVHALARLARLLVALGVDQYQLAFVHPVGAVAARFTALVPRLEIASPQLRRALQVGIDAGVPCWTEAVPYCVLPGYERCVVEQHIPRTRVVDAGVTVEDYRRYRLDEGKRKGPRCPACVHDEVCEGPWRKYPETYGFDELRPVAGADGAG